MKQVTCQAAGGLGFKVLYIKRLFMDKKWSPEEPVPPHPALWTPLQIVDVAFVALHLWMNGHQLRDAENICSGTHAWLNTWLQTIVTVFPAADKCPLCVCVCVCVYWTSRQASWYLTLNFSHMANTHTFKHLFKPQISRPVSSNVPVN